MVTPSAFALLGANVSNPAWNGAPMTLGWHETATMPQTPEGSMILAFQNLTATNSDGTLALTSASQPPRFLAASAGDLAPAILVNNWHANDLKLTNVSANTDVPISIQAFGPGMPGQTPKCLTASAPVAVQPGDTLLGAGDGGWMHMIFEASSGALGVFALIGGPKDPSGNNAYVFAVNLSQPPPPPQGYASTTAGNRTNYQFNWASRFYVAYFGPAHLVAAEGLGAAPQPTVTLLAL